jgi:hypothetical protein
MARERGSALINALGLLFMDVKDCTVVAHEAHGSKLYQRF